MKDVVAERQGCTSLFVFSYSAIAGVFFFFLFSFWGTYMALKILLACVNNSAPFYFWVHCIEDMDNNSYHRLIFGFTCSKSFVWLESALRAA
jgi:hypothetical protein